MINYPKNYAPLAEEEMEYTSGGLSINWMALGSTVMGLATSMLAYLNVSNIAGVAVQLQKKDPEKYPEPEATLTATPPIYSLHHSSLNPLIPPTPP